MASDAHFVFTVNLVPWIVVTTVLSCFAGVAVPRTQFRWKADPWLDITAESRAALAVLSAIGLDRAAAAVVHVAGVTATGLLGGAVDAFTIGQARCAASTAAELVPVAIGIAEAGGAGLAQNPALAGVRVVDGVRLATNRNYRCRSGRAGGSGDLRFETSHADVRDADQVAAARRSCRTAIALRRAAGTAFALERTATVALRAG